MKRILLAILLLCVLVPLGGVGITDASAACGGSSAQMKDNLASTFNMALANDPTGTNCSSVIAAAAAEATVSAGNTLNAVVANTTGTSVPVTGYGAALINVNCSVNCTGGTTVQFQASDVVGFQGVGAMPVAGGSAMVTSVVNQSGAAMFCIPNMGYTNMRANVASYSAGTISVTITPINAATCDVAQIANALAAVANNADSIAPSASLANSPVLSYNMGFDGSNWDRQGIDNSTNRQMKTIGALNQTPNDCSGSVTTGGTAQNALAAQTTLHGLTIMNIDTTEPLWISFTGTAVASTPGSFPLQAATASTFASPGSFTTPAGFGTNHALSVIAATTGHKWSCTWW